MQPEWKILAPVDLNRDSNAAIEHAIAFADAVTGGLVLLHVGNRSFSAAKSAGEHIEYVSLPGDPARTIGKYADAIHANVILVTPRLERCWAKLGRRSVMAGVLQSARKPVLLTRLPVPEMKHHPGRRKILVVLNLDGTDGPLLDCANNLGVRFDAEIEAVHVMPQASEALLAWGLPQTNRPLSHGVALDRMDAATEKLSVPHRSSVTVGGLQKGVLAAICRTRPMLTIVGRAMPGQWTPDAIDPRVLLRKCGRPVLAVPAPETRREARRGSSGGPHRLRLVYSAPNRKPWTGPRARQFNNLTRNGCPV